MWNWLVAFFAGVSLTVAGWFTPAPHTPPSLVQENSSTELSAQGTSSVGVQENNTPLSTTKEESPESEFEKMYLSQIVDHIASGQPVCAEKFLFPGPYKTLTGPTPTCKLTAKTSFGTTDNAQARNAVIFANPNEEVQLTWSSQNADCAYSSNYDIEGRVYLPPNGSVKVTPGSEMAAYVFTFYSKNSHNTASCVASIVTSSAASIPTRLAVINNFEADLETISLGETALLSWSASWVDTCQLSAVDYMTKKVIEDIVETSSYGTQGLASAIGVSPAKTTIYRLSCVGTFSNTNTVEKDVLVKVL